MTGADQIDTPAERRAIQRDWMGHAVQLLGVLVLLGLPIAYWGSNINTTVATIDNEVKHHKQDISDQRQIQILLTNQIIETGKQLTRIETQIGAIIAQDKPKR